VDWVSRAIELSERYKSRYSSPCGFSVELKDDVFIFNDTVERDDLDTCNMMHLKLKEDSFIKIKLPYHVTLAINELESISHRILLSISNDIKKKLNNKCRKLSLLHNIFSYSQRKNVGKDSFKIRGLTSNCKAKLSMDGFDDIDNLFDKIYQVNTYLHEIGIKVMEAITKALYKDIGDYLLSKIEQVWDYPSTSPYQLSYMNLLSYYDPEKPVPVDPHTDYTLITVLPLNSKGEALEVWSCKENKWIGLESSNTTSFTEAIVIVGETLSRITNDYFLSTVHRVVAPKYVPRFSCPFFISAKQDTILDTIYIGESKIFGPSVGELKPPIDPISFMWECIKKPNYTEESIMERYHAKLNR